jgi:hypothetical protein
MRNGKCGSHSLAATPTAHQTTAAGKAKAAITKRCQMASRAAPTERRAPTDVAAFAPQGLAALDMPKTAASTNVSATTALVRVVTPASEAAAMKAIPAPATIIPHGLRRWIADNR